MSLNYIGITYCFNALFIFFFLLCAKLCARQYKCNLHFGVKCAKFSNWVPPKNYDTKAAARTDIFNYAEIAHDPIRKRPKMVSFR